MQELMKALSAKDRGDMELEALELNDLKPNTIMIIKMLLLGEMLERGVEGANWHKGENDF